HDVHEHRRRVEGGAAGDVDADAVEGGDPLAQDRAVGSGLLPRLAQVAFVEAADVVVGPFERAAQVRIDAGRGAINLVGRELELVGAQLDAIEPGGELGHGVVAPRAYGLDDGAHGFEALRLALLRLRVRGGVRRFLDGRPQVGVVTYFNGSHLPSGLPPD